MNARTEPPQDDENPCLLPPKAGYLRLENQLYRVEVHQGGDRIVRRRSSGRATTPRSRPLMEKIDGSVMTVSDIGKDEVLGLCRRNGWRS